MANKDSQMSQRPLVPAEAGYGKIGGRRPGGLVTLIFHWAPTGPNFPRQRGPCLLCAALLGPSNQGAGYPDPHLCIKDFMMPCRL